MDGRFFKETRTPHIYNNIIKKGIKFTNFYVETSLCCPARAGYLTGQHTQNHGVDDLDGTKFNPQVNLGTETRAAGYFNIYTGKYLNRYLEFPTSKKIPPGWDKFDAINANNGKYYDYQIIHRNGTTDYYGNRASDYSTDVLINHYWFLQIPILFTAHICPLRDILEMTGVKILLNGNLPITTRATDQIRLSG
jgi:arylsulfatase A-like enzyme